MKIKLQHVHFMPNVLKPGILYVSEEFDAAAHLCACGCGSKIRTPLGPTEWALKEKGDIPTLYPSIGNWQQACQSHYWIYKGVVIWSGSWSAEQIAEGNRRTEERRSAYYDTIHQHDGTLRKIWRWIKELFKR